MKRYVFFCILTLICFSSCDTYVRVMTFRSTANNMDSSSLIFDNDSLRINYNFYGKGSGIGITVFNKLSKPLYIDWGRSSYIIGDKKYSYWQNESNLTVSHTDEKGVENVYMTQAERYAFIPPNTSVSKYKDLYIPVNFRLVSMQKEGYLKVKSAYTNRDFDSFKIKEAGFTRQNTPFVFRNYLTISTDSKFGTEGYLDHEFWISEVKDMKTRKFLGPYTDGYGNSRYTEPFKNPNCFYIIYDPQDSY
jgi:hypothetical protein